VQVVDDTFVFWVFFRWLKFCSSVWFRLLRQNMVLRFSEISFQTFVITCLFVFGVQGRNYFVFFRRKLEKLLQGKGTPEMFKGTVIVYR